MGVGKDDKSYQLVKLKREKFLAFVERLTIEYGQYRLCWESYVFGIQLADYPEYNVSLFLEGTPHLETVGFVVLRDDFEVYEQMIAQLDAAVDSSLAIKRCLPSGFKFKLAAVWAQKPLLVAGDLDPHCDVILDYEGQPVA
jgi:hypothetical protein